MLRWFQYILRMIAIAGIGLYLGSMGEEWASQAYLNWQFAQKLEMPARAEPAKLRIGDGAEPLGRLEIPSIDLSALFVEGDDDGTLRRAIGHIPGTAAAGTVGNVGLSAHRDTFFRRLRELKKGDEIRITTPGGHYKYVVESVKIVAPDERAVLRDIGRPTLTLVTCYPFYYIGPAPQRFVVHAALVDESDLSGN